MLGNVDFPGVLKQERKVEKAALGVCISDEKFLNTV